MTKYILGIDGGGTKTDAVLLAPDGSLATHASAGASNVQLVGADEAALVVLDLARQCCKQASCKATELQAIGVGLAGAGRESDRTLFRERLMAQARKVRFVLPTLLIETDARVALEGALPTSAGIVLIAGTGSVACAKAEDWRIHRVGGWGRVLGDAGSAYSIGREAVQAALRVFEGRGDATLLTNQVLSFFGIERIEEIITLVHQGKADLAAFAPQVIEAESKRDHVAHGILFRAAGELAELVRVLVVRLQPRRKLPVVLIGGLVENESSFTKMVRERISRSLPQVLIQKPKFPPAYGAAILAFRPFEFRNSTST